MYQRGRWRSLASLGIVGELVLHHPIALRAVHQMWVTGG